MVQGKGRPKVAHPQRKRQFRATDLLWWQVERAATRSGETISEWVRKALEQRLAARDH